MGRRREPKREFCITLNRRYHKKPGEEAVISYRWAIWLNSRFLVASSTTTYPTREEAEKAALTVKETLQ